MLAWNAEAGYVEFTHIVENSKLSLMFFYERRNFLYYNMQLQRRMIVYEKGIRKNALRPMQGQGKYYDSCRPERE